MKNYPIDESVLPAIRVMSKSADLSYSYKPCLMRPGKIWLSLFHRDGSDLSPEHSFYFGRLLEQTIKIVELDASATRTPETYFELIEDLP